MKNIKILWSTMFSLMIIWIFSFASSIVIGDDTCWYLTMRLPSFAPSAKVIALLWVVNYISFAVILTRLVYLLRSGKHVMIFISGLVADLLFLILLISTNIILGSLICLYIVVAVWLIITFMLYYCDMTSFFISLYNLALMVFLVVLAHVIYLI